MSDDSRNADVGARYAVALFELADEAGTIAAVEADLNGLEALRVESADLNRVLTSPTFTGDQKAAGLTAVATAAGVSEVTLKFIGVLCRNNRASALPMVVAEFRRLAAERRGAVAAEVTTAMALTAAQKKGVAASLRTALGKDPEITTVVDPKILGGIKVRVGSRLFDASLKSQLDSLKFALKRA